MTRNNDAYRADEPFFTHQEIAELEAFLDNPDSTEHDASRLFARIPKFLLLGSGIELHREVALKNRSRVDFFRREYGSQYWDLIELKTPHTPLVIDTDGTHPRLSQKVTQAISQAQDYRLCIIQNCDIRTHLMRRGIRVGFPRMIVIVGRTSAALSSVAHSLLDRSYQAGVTVLSYDHLLRFAREHYRSHKHISIPAYVPSFRDFELTARLAGFDRVRLYKYDGQEQTFRGLECIDRSGLLDFKNLRIPVTAIGFGNDVVQSALGNPKPLIVQHDGYWSELEMKENEPFAVVPIVSQRLCCGQITADNHISGQDITPENLELLALLGRLAAPLLARLERCSEKLKTSEL